MTGIRRGTTRFLLLMAMAVWNSISFWMWFFCWSSKSSTSPAQSSDFPGCRFHLPILQPLQQWKVQVKSVRPASLPPVSFIAYKSETKRVFYHSGRSSYISSGTLTDSDNISGSEKLHGFTNGTAPGMEPIRQVWFVRQLVSGLADVLLNQCNDILAISRKTFFI